MSRLKTALILIPVILLTACGGEPEDTRPGQPVAHRRAAFKEIIKYFEPMGVMIRANEYDAAKFQSLTLRMMELRDKPWEYFGPDTNYPPSRSREEVWTQPEKFEAGKKAFFDATDKLAAIAGTKDKREAGAAFQAVQKTCKDCHDAFKND
ncbi:MAG: cytochrome c [Gammaproteobacteria bacterium]|nr:cytochrome c [Gammaproteobacteria bacterium]MBU1416432.1 cytochrome c [Gammaproteobacteria bacterium]